MKQLTSIIFFICATILSVVAQNLSGVWDGPNGVQLTINHNPSTGKLVVESCEIYRVTAWNVATTLKDGVLTIKEKGSANPEFLARLAVNNYSDKLTGSLKMGVPGDDYYFNGTATFTKSGALDAEAQLHSMGGATYIYSGNHEGLEIWFTVGATAHVEGRVWAQDDVEFNGTYSFDGYDVTIKTENPYLGSNGYFVGTFAPDMQTLTIHNYGDGSYSSPARVLRLKTETPEPKNTFSDNVDLGVKPLTQYLLVKVVDDGIGVTFRDNIAAQLKSLGFKVTTYQRPPRLDEMESYLSLKATRQGKNGITKIEMESGGEDPVCTIDFANQAEADKFVESMLVSDYIRDGNLYSHPANGLAKIYVKVIGKRVKLISPVEMLPYDF